MAKRIKSKIVRHKAPKAADSRPLRQLTRTQMIAVERHVGRHVGKWDSVWHEIMSDDVHLDLLPVGATKKRPFQTIVTMGMSAAPMNVPKGCPASRRLELFVVLPPEWPTDEKGLKARGDRNWWPCGGLKQLGRLPCTYDTFLDVGHTVPNGDPPEPFAASCKFVCWLVMPPLTLPEGFAMLKSPRFNVAFLQIVPLYREEMELKLEHGVGAVIDAFEAAGLDPIRLCDPKRANAAGKKR